MEDNVKPSRVFSRLNNLHNRLDILLDDITKKGWNLESLMLRMAVRNVRKALEAVRQRKDHINGA